MKILVQYDYPPSPGGLATQGDLLYRGLKEYTDVPTVLLVYPGAGHGLTVYNHRKAKMEWDLAWFEKYLLGETDEAGEKSSK